MSNILAAKVVLSSCCATQTDDEWQSQMEQATDCRLEYILLLQLCGGRLSCYAGIDGFVFVVWVPCYQPCLSPHQTIQYVCPSFAPFYSCLFVCPFFFFCSFFTAFACFSLQHIYRYINWKQRISLHRFSHFVPFSIYLFSLLCPSKFVYLNCARRAGMLWLRRLWHVKTVPGPIVNRW